MRRIRLLGICTHGCTPATRSTLRHASALQYATALGCLNDRTMYPIDMNTMRFFGRVTGRSFSGMALSDAEGDRVANLMGEDKTVLLMANHGVLVVGPTVAAAFDELFYFERAAETLLTCYATGKELRHAG